MASITPVSLKGHFVVAMPGLADPNFSQTVTCICEHSDQGAMGIIVNRLHEDLTAQDIFDELSISTSPQAASIPVHLGGPVHSGELFILHGPPFDWQTSLMVTESVSLSNSLDILKAIAQGRGPRAFLISLGCAGWGPDQLESEIRENAWLTHPVFDENVFVLPVEKRWDTALERMGVNPMALSGVGGQA